MPLPVYNQQLTCGDRKAQKVGKTIPTVLPELESVPILDDSKLRSTFYKKLFPIPF